MLGSLRNIASCFGEHLRDPEDVAKGVRLIDAFALLLGRGDETMLRRMRESPLGSKLLDERHSILSVLVDRKRLRELPPGSLGREYAEFAEARQLYPERLAAVVDEARADSGGRVPQSSDEVAYLHDSFRDCHDMWHVVTGYGTDMGGELGLHGFQTQQTHYRAMAIASFLSVLRAILRGRFDMLGVWWGGRRRARRARFLLAEDWDTLLTLPLAEVRSRLRLDPLPEYRTYEVQSGE